MHAERVSMTIGFFDPSAMPRSSWRIRGLETLPSEAEVPDEAFDATLDRNLSEFNRPPDADLQEHPDLDWQTRARRNGDAVHHVDSSSRKPIYRDFHFGRPGSAPLYTEALKSKTWWGLRLPNSARKDAAWWPNENPTSTRYTLACVRHAIVITRSTPS
jgi:hypothetical protein